MTKWLALIMIIAAAAAVARLAVYGSGSALGGYVVLSAFTGGVALAFSRPFLLVLVPYLTVLFGDLKKEGLQKEGLRTSQCYLGAFALAFVVTISGVPRALATPIHQSEWLVDPAGGVVFLVWGFVSFRDLLFPGPVHPTQSIWGRVVSSGSAGLVGATTGVLMYHELDPTYDSVFFFTANAVAASHAPLTVAVFTTGLGLTYLAAGSAATAMASQTRWGRTVLIGGRVLSGIATALIGLAVLTRRFGAVRGLLF